MSELSGGSNPPVSTGESKIAVPMKHIFAVQYHDAIKREVWDKMDFDWVASKAWADEIYKYTHGQIGVFLVQGGKKASEQVGVHLTDFIDRPAVQHAARKETYQFANAVGHSTKDKLKATLEEAHANGETIDEMKKRIKTTLGFDPDKDVYTDYEESKKMSNWRAERIARTESARAVGVGTRQGYVESGVVKAAVWKTASDACPFCMDMDGEEVPLNQPFLKEGEEQDVEYGGDIITLVQDYSDVLAPPLHPNCRCTLVPRLLDIYEDIIAGKR